MMTASDLEEAVAKAIARGQLLWSVKETTQQVPSAFMIDKIISDAWTSHEPAAQQVRACARDIARRVLAISEIKTALGAVAKRPEPLPVIDVEAL